ncbi:ABC transporter ATP-binding protein [Rubrobacter aplysinae]|uniref:ABC transporter ATP-binding protein n=1 Tax=Rubrobacter aplysinae TaxID=909625 RepID=UPI00064C3BCC|nr:ABC transporter ATP-binding protein [Rubrobacter aplysinae]
MGNRLELENVTHVYPGGEEPALSGLSLTVEPGELVAFLGPSGCGKTTALKAISGLLRTTSGDIRVGGASTLGLPPERREAAMVFQKALLFPHMTVAENVGFGLKMRKVGRGEADRRVEEALRRVRMDGYADRKPGELSGGQQQRAALARALVTEPGLLLLDEPFSSLDANLRGGMRELVKELQQEGGHTTVFVTHDQEEAVVLADRIALLGEGRLLMYDEPQAFFDRPASRHVAEFFGGANFIPGEAENGHVLTPLGPLSTSEPAPQGPVTLTIRPEAIRLDDPKDGENAVTARIVSTTYLGRHTTCILEAEGMRLRAALPPDTRVSEGDEVSAVLPATALWPLGGER